MDVAFDRFLGVIGFLADRWHEETFEMERDDLPLVRLTATDELDVATCW